MTETTERFAPGTFSRPSSPASTGRMLAAQTRMELGLFLRNGEQLLVALVIPVAILVGLTLVDLGRIPEPRVDGAITAVLTIAVMGTAFTGQAIAVGFDRRYGALKRLGGTPLLPAVIIGGKMLSVLVLVVLQSVLLGLLAVLLGWRPDPAGLAPAALLLVLGTFTFSAMGLLLGGTLKAELVLALANLIWFLLMGAAALAVGITALPGHLHEVLLAVPSYALTSAVGDTLHGGVPVVAALSLLVWGGVCAFLATRWFSFT